MVRMAAFAIAAALACSCGKSDTTGKADPVAEPSPAFDATPSMKARFERIKREISPLQPWDESFAKMAEIAGKPQLIERDAYHWYTLDDGNCLELRVVRNKDKVAALRIKPYPPAVKTMFARCE